MNKIIDKKISLGTLLTMGTLIGTFVYTQGIFSAKVDSFEKEITVHSVKTNKNSDKIQKLEVSVAKIESKLDNRFDKLEELLKDLE